MVEQSQFSHEANCKTEEKRIDRAEDPSIRIRAIVVSDLSPEKEREREIGEDCYSSGKNQRCPAVSDGKVHFNYRFARRSARSRTWMVAISA